MVSIAARLQASWGDLLVTGAPDEWLRSILGPQVLVIEGSSIPHDFVHDLRYLDGMG